MNDGRNILSDDKAKALRAIIEQEEAGQVYAIPTRGNCKTMAAKAALERAAEPSAAVLGQLWETARATMNEAAEKPGEEEQK